MKTHWGKRCSCIFFNLFTSSKVRDFFFSYFVLFFGTLTPDDVHSLRCGLSPLVRQKFPLLSSRKCKHPTLSASAPWWPGVGLFALPGSATQLVCKRCRRKITFKSRCSTLNTTYSHDFFQRSSVDHLQTQTEQQNFILKGTIADY